MSQPQEQVYQIHDNGGRPFSVKIVPTTGAQRYNATIYKNKWDNQTNQDVVDKVIATFNDAIVHIGKSPDTPGTVRSGGNGPAFDGNSVLIQSNKDTLEYVFVGWEVYRFVALSPIDIFWSPVGNSDVPYPYAIDTQLRVYAFIDNAVLSKCHLHPDFSTHPAKFDPYDTYGMVEPSPADKLLRDVVYKELPPKNGHDFEHNVGYHTDMTVAPESRKYWRQSDGQTVSHEEVKRLIADAMEQSGFAFINIVEVLHPRL